MGSVLLESKKMSNIFDNLWVEKYRPQKYNDLVLSEDILEWINITSSQEDLPHILLCGSPGVGKTTLAKIIVKHLDAVYRYINASDERGIDSVREKIVPFAQTKSPDGSLKIIILDEVDGFTSDAQRALRNIIEEYSDNIRFILTANYENRIITPIKSRVVTYKLVPPFDGVVARIKYILENEHISVSEEQQKPLKELIERNFPDIRKIIGLVQKYSKNGVLNIIQNNNECIFAKEVLQKITTEHNVVNIREFIIQNEIEFNSDYLVLLKGLFEEIYNSKIDDSKKASALVTIGEFLYKHQFVMDHEINSFCCIIQLSNIIK